MPSCQGLIFESNFDGLGEIIFENGMLKMDEEIIRQAVSINDPEFRELVASLYTQWETWDCDLFGSIFTSAELQPLIRIASTDEIDGLGRFQTRNESNYNQSTIMLSQTILNGQGEQRENGDCYHQGQILHLKDILLHEMIHQFQHDVVYHGTTIKLDEEWGVAWEEENRKCGGCKLLKSHGIVFSKMANRIAEILRLNQVGCQCEPNRLVEFGGRLSREFPMCCRSSEYYEGAYEFGRA